MSTHKKGKFMNKKGREEPEPKLNVVPTDISGDIIAALKVERNIIFCNIAVRYAKSLTRGNQTEVSGVPLSGSLQPREKKL